MIDQQLTDLARAVGDRLRRHELRIATAESCTGGLIAHAITEIAGCSEYFRGGIVAYSNDSKMSLLQVAEQTLALHGAVSAQTALEMARGALRAFGAHVAIATTGIAGPDGATPDKPVGLVYGAIIVPDDMIVQRWTFTGDRSAIKQQTAVAALREVLEMTMKDRE